MNRCIFSGRLARDPELKFTSDGVPVLSNALAIDDGYKEKKRTFYPTVVFWRHNAEFVAKYAQKGDLIEVEAKLSERKWTDKEGHKRTSTEFVVDEVKILAKKRTSSDQTADQAADQGDYPEYSGEGYGAPAFGPNDFTEIKDDDGDLPF